MEFVFELLNSVHPLSTALTEHLSQVIRHRQLQRKDYLLRAGHICRHLYFIESGLLRCFYLKRETEICSWFMREGDVIVSIESFLKQQESYESIQVLEDCSLYSIGYNDLQFIYKNFPEFNFTGRVLLEKYFIQWTQQLYGLRMQQAADRYQWLLTNHPDLILRVPAKYLASWIGISDVMLSKVKNNFLK
jgi:CRP-like cAMP-binding protein